MAYRIEETTEASKAQFLVDHPKADPSRIGNFAVWDDNILMAWENTKEDAEKSIADYESVDNRTSIIEDKLEEMIEDIRSEHGFEIDDIVSVVKARYAHW